MVYIKPDDVVAKMIEIGTAKARLRALYHKM